MQRESDTQGIDMATSSGRAKVAAYTSPTLVFLAMDWSAGIRHADFLGFAIQRSPGYSKSGVAQFLFNKIDFKPIKLGDRPKPSDAAPIQKFNWWDGGINSADRGREFTYTVFPVLGHGPDDLRLQDEAAASIKVTIPHEVVDGIGTYFNRAVVSSQSFTGMVNKGQSLEKQMAWLANGIETAVPAFLNTTGQFACAIYHLTDKQWIAPALQKFKGEATIVYFFKAPSATAKTPGGDTTNEPARALLERAQLEFTPRSHIKSLMHDKFIVAYQNGKSAAVLTGSMNFTPEAQAIQANVLHTFASPKMAALYAERYALLLSDPSTAKTAAGAAWLPVGDVKGSKIRLIFSPEPAGQRLAIDAIVDAVSRAKSSVMFCMFSPTDAALLKALLDAGDQGKIMYGLLNSITDPKTGKQTADGAAPGKSQQILVEVYNRSRRDKKAIAYDFFGKDNAPRGFLPEFSTIDLGGMSLAPHGKGVAAVHIHHKFIIIDANASTPVVYTGSANMSKNSVEYNDENLLEIRGNSLLARTYLAEFMRLYNHYRARALWDLSHPRGGKAQ